MKSFGFTLANFMDRGIKRKVSNQSKKIYPEAKTHRNENFYHQKFLPSNKVTNVFKLVMMFPRPTVIFNSWNQYLPKKLNLKYSLFYTE